MLGAGWMLRMARWARHPPSWGRVKLVVAIVAACAVLFVIERYVGWPDWLRVGDRPGRVVR